MKDNEDNKLKIKQDDLIKKMKVLNKHQSKEKSIMELKSNWDSTLRNNKQQFMSAQSQATAA